MAIGNVRTIAVSNNKGGSGKTTTTVSLASAFGERGIRVLVIDLDPQGSATEWLGATNASVGLLELARGGARVWDAVATTNATGVSVLPADPTLATIEDDGTRLGAAVARAFARVPDYWDVVLIDTPPSLGPLTLVPLVASDVVVIPVEAHALALPGVASVVASIERARLHVNRRLELLGIIPCRVTATSHARDVVDRLRTEYGSAVLDQVVREGVQIAEAPAFRQSIMSYAPTSAVAQDYRAVADELLDRLGDLSSR
jgi:chromosome partitioning protein